MLTIPLSLLQLISFSLLLLLLSSQVRFANGQASTASLRLKMQRVMQNNAAVFRTGEVLTEGLTSCR